MWRGKRRNFNRRLQCIQKFASGVSDYAFFSINYAENGNYYHSNIEIAKLASSTLTTKMLSSNFKETERQLIAENKAYIFMNPLLHKEWWNN